MTSPEPTPAPAIELRGIDKHFGAVYANKSIDLTVAKGTIHGIIGENGAGKSTLMSILYGYYEADDGDILIDGKKTRIATPQDAIAAGIGMVHQHFMLVDNFSVLENIILGAEGGGLLGPVKGRATQSLSQLKADYDLDVDPDALVENLAIGIQQRVEIIKALFRGAEVLILDEPTGVLTPAEADHLFRIFRQLRDQGKTVILITHKLREIMAVTDSVSVMRQGEMVGSVKTSETSEVQLAEMMVGRRVLLRAAEPALRVENITVRDRFNVPRVDGVSFEVRAGEIVGIAGVAGNGQSELLQALAGISALAAGRIRIGEHDITPTAPANPAKIRDWVVGHVPEDRQHMGLVMPFEEYENSVLGYHRDKRYGSGLLLDLASMREDAVEKIEKYDIRPPNCRLRTANFSGGNQQKIVIAREVETNPALLLVGQPTRGVDIGAIEFIHKRLIEMRDAGKAVLLVSVELDEIMSLADRILVMFAGRIVGELDAKEATEKSLGLMMAGIEREATP